MLLKCTLSRKFVSLSQSYPRTHLLHTICLNISIDIRNTNKLVVHCFKSIRQITTIPISQFKLIEDNFETCLQHAQNKHLYREKYDL